MHHNYWACALGPESYNYWSPWVLGPTSHNNGSHPVQPKKKKKKERKKESGSWYRIAIVWSLRHVWLFVTLWTEAYQAFLSFTISQRFCKFMSIESMMLSNHLILCSSLLLTLIFPSITVFSNESALHIRWPKYWSFSFSISFLWKSLKWCQKLATVIALWKD